MASSNGQKLECKKSQTSIDAVELSYNSRTNLNQKDLVLVPIKFFNTNEKAFFLNELKKKVDNNNLTRQFFTLGLLEYLCNILNPNDENTAQIQFKGKYFCYLILKNNLTW